MMFDLAFTRKYYKVTLPLDFLGNTIDEVVALGESNYTGLFDDIVYMLADSVCVDEQEVLTDLTNLGLWQPNMEMTLEQLQKITHFLTQQKTIMSNTRGKTYGVLESAKKQKKLKFCDFSDISDGEPIVDILLEELEKMLENKNIVKEVNSKQIVRYLLTYLNLLDSAIVEYSILNKEYIIGGVASNNQSNHLYITKYRDTVRNLVIDGLTEVLQQDIQNFNQAIRENSQTAFIPPNYKSNPQDIERMNKFYNKLNIEEYQKVGLEVLFSPNSGTIHLKIKHANTNEPLVVTVHTGKGRGVYLYSPNPEVGRKKVTLLEGSSSSIKISEMKQTLIKIYKSKVIPENAKYNEMVKDFITKF